MASATASARISPVGQAAALSDPAQSPRIARPRNSPAGEGRTGA
ncbi:hypothetical protein [Streptomyces sp. NBC_01578]